jgi:hypothetical protein
MAVSGYSIWHIHQEFPQYAAYKDLGQLGSLIIGRPWGNTISINEFYGRSNILTYNPNFPAYPANEAYYSFATAHGTFWYLASSHESGGNNRQTLDLSYTVSNNPTVWSKFIRCEIPWMGYSLDVNWWAGQGYRFTWYGGNFSGGAMPFTIYG